MKTRLVVLPGHIISKDDGDEHFVTSSQLLRLYRIKQPYPWNDLLVVQENLRHTYEPQIGDVRLYPRVSGKYELPNPLTKRDIDEINTHR